MTSKWMLARGIAMAALAGAAAAGPGVTVLHSFDYADGQYPQGLLLFGSDGRIYGTTSAGGTAGLGSAFAVSTDKTHTILHSFSGPDGNSLDGGLVQSADGTLFGTTPQGSYCVGSVCSNFGGSVFTMAGDGGAFATLRRFSGNGLPDGSQPGTLVDGGDGFYYGTARSGGANSLGAVFKVAPDGSLGTIFNFDGTSGYDPDRLLTRGSDGALYGALRYGPGGNPAGALFRLATDGSFTVLHNFDATTDGSGPSGGLVELNGAFYGVSGSRGIGVGGAGTVFRVYPNGAFTTLKAFNGTDGASPVGPLAAGPDGKLYGLTFGGGPKGGTIFRIEPLGTFMTLHGLTTADGTHPVSGPVIGADGLLYGATTQYGGSSGASGSVFQFDPLAQQPAELSMTKFCYNEFDTCFRPINTWVGMPYDIIWNSANVGDCIAGGAWAGRKPPGGRLQFLPTKPGVFTYRLRCTGPDGAKRNASVVVTVG
jgi:uncharacterized repeat protein (TIGR03803 family)